MAKKWNTNFEYNQDSLVLEFEGPVNPSTEVLVGMGVVAFLHEHVHEMQYDIMDAIAEFNGQFVSTYRLRFRE